MLMETVNGHSKASSLRREIQFARSEGKTIGFVPTMGALHEGHLNLIKKAYTENDVVVVSIFVNPTQFNNQQDLALYPRMLDRDIETLRTLNFQLILFAPEVHEIYPDDDFFEPIDLKGLDRVLEGTYRPGHFQGVVHVVRNLFQIVEPDVAYFGRKDLQQLAVIRLMTSAIDFNISIVGCDTLREQSGLAMSSRNLRLDEQQKADALIIYKTLISSVEWSKKLTPQEVKNRALEMFAEGNLKLEYLELVDDLTFRPLDDTWSTHSSCCIAAYCGEVRLIDNMSCR